jgi:hypothetical protein
MGKTGKGHGPNRVTDNRVMTLATTTKPTIKRLMLVDGLAARRRGQPVLALARLV